MGSLEKAIKKLAEFKNAQQFKDLFDEEIPFEEDEFDNTILEADKDNNEDNFWEEDFDIKETPVPSGKKPLIEDEEKNNFNELDLLVEKASNNTKKLLKMAIKLKKLGDLDSNNDDDKNYFETAITPDEIDAWDEEDIPDQYKMQQLSKEDIGSIYGMDPENAFVEDPITGKKHYDVESDFSMFDEDFEEKSTEAPTEIEDFIRQMELELAKERS